MTTQQAGWCMDFLKRMMANSLRGIHPDERRLVYHDWRYWPRGRGMEYFNEELIQEFNPSRHPSSQLQFQNACSCCEEHSQCFLFGSTSSYFNSHEAPQLLAVFWKDNRSYFMYDVVENVVYEGELR